MKCHLSPPHAGHRHGEMAVMEAGCGLERGLPCSLPIASRLLLSAPAARAAGFSASKSGREPGRALMAHRSASLGAPDGRVLPEAASKGGPGGKPRLLRGTPKADGGSQTDSIPPWCSESPRGGSSFLSLCWGKFPDLDIFSLLPFSPGQSKPSKVLHDKDHGSRVRCPYRVPSSVQRLFAHVGALFGCFQWMCVAGTFRIPVQQARKLMLWEVGNFPKVTQPGSAMAST